MYMYGVRPYPRGLGYANLILKYMLQYTSIHIFAYIYIHILCLYAYVSTIKSTYPYTRGPNPARYVQLDQS